MGILSGIKKASGYVVLLVGAVLAITSLQHAPKAQAAGEISLNWTSLTTVELSGPAIANPPVVLTGSYAIVFGSNGQTFQSQPVMVNFTFGCKADVNINVTPDAGGPGAEYTVADNVIFIKDQSAGSTCTEAQLKAGISGLVPLPTGGSADIALLNYPVGSVSRRTATSGGDVQVNVLAGLGPASANTGLPTTDTFILCAAVGPYATNKDLLDQDCLSQKAGAVLQTTVSGTLQTVANGQGPNNGDEQAWPGTFPNNVAPGNYDVCSINFNACKLVQMPRDKDVRLDLTLPNVTVPGTPTGTTAPSQDVCDNANFTELNFFFCAIIKAVSATIQGLDSQILDALKIDTDGIFNDSGTKAAGDSYFVVWSLFRNIAYAMVLLAMGVALLAQLLQIDIISAYQFRKLLPLAGVVLVITPFLWNGLDYAYNASNDGADAVQAIIAAPFSKIDVTIGNTTSNNLTLGALMLALPTIGTAVGVAALAILGLGGIAALVATILLTVGSAWVLLELRNVIAELLIITSAPAVASALFGKKLLKLWLGLNATILLSVPGIAAVLKLCEEAAKISYVNNHVLVAIVILGGGYGLVWKVWTTLDKVSGQLGNGIATMTAGARKAAGQYRKDTMKRRLNEAVEGKRDIRGAGWAVRTVRRAKNADQGGLSMTRAGRARYAGAERTHLDATVAEMMKRDHGRAGGDDDAMEIAMQEGMDDRRFMQEYSQRRQAQGIAQPEADRQAEDALGKVRTSFGAQLGTDAMRVAAYRSLLDSKTSYADPTGANGQDNFERMIGDGNALMADGLMSSSDVTMAMKSRADRADRAGIGFGTLQGQVDRSFTRYQQGARRGTTSVNGAELVSADEARAMRKEALFGTQAGGIVGGRHEAVSALSGTMRDNVQETYQNLQNARTAGGGVPTPVQQAAIDQAQEQFDRELAAIAGRYDAMGQVSPQNATIMANNVMSQVMPGGPISPTTGQPMTIQEMVEAARGNQGFLEMRREYMQNGLAAAAAAASGIPAPSGPPST